MVNGDKPTIALFGGSFDPPHSGHQQIVKEALTQLDIDTLIIMPAYLNPFKSSSMAHAAQRLKWCDTLFGNIPKVIVSDYEISQGRSIKTAESVRHLQKRFDIKYLIIGADNLTTLSQWYDFDWLNKQITWVVVTRPGYELQTDMLCSWRLLTLNVPVSSSEIRQGEKIESVDKHIVKDVKKQLKDKPK